jgi:hypothetical protein
MRFVKDGGRGSAVLERTITEKAFSYQLSAFSHTQIDTAAFDNRICTQDFDIVPDR